MMNRETGRAMTEADHIRQSVRDILITPQGSRIMRRDYGSLIPELIDQPMHAGTRLRLMSATVMALMRWEPRLSISATTIDVAASGAVTVDMEATRRTGPRSGAPINLSIPLK